MLKSVDRLKSDGLIVKTMGCLPKVDFSLAMILQARSVPKLPFEAFVFLSKVLSSLPLTVYVDNLYSRVFFNRTKDEQLFLDQQYLDYFTARGCKIVFSEDIFSGCSPPLFFRLFDYASRVSAGELISCLPIEKRKKFDSLALDEIIHLMMELLFMEEIKKHHNVILVGHGSQAIVAEHRNVAESPLPAIVLPRFLNAKEVHEYVGRLR